MKTLLFTSVIFLTIFFKINAQNLIAVQNGGTPSFYTVLDSAITQAQNGDTIYISGGIFALNVSINKNLHIVGVGHHPDSSTATNVTYIIGYLTLLTGSNGSSITGLYLQTGLSFGSSFNFPYDSISNCFLSRCYIGSLGVYYSSLTNIVFCENIIMGTASSGYYPVNISFFNNIIGGYCGINSNTIYKNNIFLYENGNSYYWQPTVYGQSGIFENNIFVGEYSNTYSGANELQFSILNNNLFVENWLGHYNCIAANNIVNQAHSSIFINQSGNTFNYSHDYHLKSTCPGKNAGKDGTDIGIYGGQFPWKEGSIPFNPHIQTKNISGTTDANGNLNVNIKVQAQDH